MRDITIWWLNVACGVKSERPAGNRVDGDPKNEKVDTSGGLFLEIIRTHTRKEGRARTLKSTQMFTTWHLNHVELPRWLSGKAYACQCRRHRFYPWVRKILWRRKWQPTPVFLPVESHGQKSLVGYSPRGHKELMYAYMCVLDETWSWKGMGNVWKNMYALFIWECRTVAWDLAGMEDYCIVPLMVCEVAWVNVTNVCYGLIT